MKLVLRAPTDNFLQLELEDLAAPVVKKLTLNDSQIQSLQHLCISYQATINKPNAIGELRTIGDQLFALLNQQSDLIGRWLNHVGKRQLEINTTLAPRPLQRLLLELPWEIMTNGNQFLASDTQLFEVVRRVGKANSAAPQARYKDMTLVFMAADPDFNSGLKYENEERAILQATRKARNLNLWVEESGNLDSLTQRITESGHCDMAHISCHGGYDETLRSFTLQLEDDLYRPQNVTASAFRGLAQCIQCLFLSACHSAEIADAPAFAMELAKIGIANVIGWDGSVSDEDATVFAAAVYHALLQQATVPFACAAARQQLLQEHQRTGKHRHWHLGRVYLTPDGGWPLIDSSKPPSPKRRGKSFHELLDRKKNVVPVASKETFVGRRKQTKQALKAFTEKTVKRVLLTGIGGTGKSSLAARIVHRMEPQYKAAIIYEDYSEAAILGELKQCVPGDSRNEDFQRYLTEIKQNPDLFADNLVDILEQDLSENPIILVVDDLEQHALEALETASEADGKVGVKPEYQNALRGVIDAFGRADTQSRLILTSRHSFRLLNDKGQDVTKQLLEIKVPDMNPVEQEKHWLALLQSGAMTWARDEAQDRAFLEQIWAICHGNPGLQDVLYQPLLKGEHAVLQTALNQLQAYHAGQLTAPATATEDIDKYLQRIALEAYHAALTDTERQCLRVLSLFDFAVPEQLIIQAGAKLGIEDAQTALRRLDNFGLLTHWQGEGLEGHLSCYGLARKIVEPLSKEDRHFISKICSPLLWHIWFADFLQRYNVPYTESFSESIKNIFDTHFPSKYSGELPLQSHQEQERLACLNRLCIGNSLTDWEGLGFDASEFIDLFELSMSLHTFEKLRVTATAVDGLSSWQWGELYKTFSDERDKFKELAKEYPQDIITLLLKQFGGRPPLLAKGYQINFGELSDDDRKLMESIKIQNGEDRHLAGIQLAKTKLQKAQAYGNYANFLAYQKQDYAQAEVMYQRTVKADPNHANNLGNYANFLYQQKQDYAQAEVMYQRAVEADPNHANNLGNYAYFLYQQKQDYAQAEVMYQRAVEADPNHANSLGNYANFLYQQKQDYAQAEVMYQRAVEADPNHANNLGNYAYFLYQQKQDYAQAEVMYQRAVEADPNHANSLGNYANFLYQQKQDYAQAEVMYQRAVEADPNHANNLGNYALFLKNQKQDYAQAEVMYQRAVKAAPNHANNLGNYAYFLADQKQDYAQAEVMYQRAVEADPNHANNLGNYAYFLYQQKQDYAQAEVMYQRAVEADPNDANNLGNYAKLLFVTKQKDKARQCLEKAESQPDLNPSLQVELAVYRYAHCQPYALAPLKQQLRSGSRSIGWDLTDNVQCACADNHSHPKLLTAIAQVISGKQDIATLDQYPEWTETP